MSWVEVGGGGWSWVEVEGAGWRWVHGLVIPVENSNKKDKKLGAKFFLKHLKK